jgi:hypothetical protein
MSQAEHPKRTRGNAIRAAVLLAAALLLAWGCCDGARIKLSRIADFLSGVVEISIDLSMDEFVSASFDGNFAAWAEIPAFSVDEIETDLTAALYATGSASFDMDNDAAAESVVVLAADDDSTFVAPIFFASWRGDKYTADKGVCYLGWVDETQVRIAATWCGDATGVMYCTTSKSGQGAPECDLCEASSGACAACDLDGRMTSCLPPKPLSGSIDIDVDIDLDVDFDVSAGAEACCVP